MKHFALLLILMTFLECSKPHCNDSNRNLALFESFNNNSTSPDFVVFTANDKLTNISKEICCESTLLYESFLIDNIDSTALLQTYRLAVARYDNIIKAQACNPSFSFKKRHSLINIRFYDYNKESVKYYAKKVTPALMDSIEKNLNENHKLTLNSYFNSPNIYLIHNLTKSGIFCHRDCVTGHIRIRKIIK